MKKLFQFWLLIFVSIAFIATIAVSWHIQSNLIRKNALDVLRVNIDDAKLRIDMSYENLQTALEYSKENALIKARALRQLCVLEPKVLEEQERLVNATKILGVDELHLSDENGILVAGVPASFKGYDMASKKQSAEFLPALTDKDFALAQPPKPRGIDGRYFQYAGVARIDKPGIAQIGVCPDYIGRVAAQADLVNIMQSVHVGMHGRLLIRESRLKPSQLYGYEKVVEKSGDEIWEYCRDELVEGVLCLCLSEIYHSPASDKEYVITACLPKDEVYLARGDAIRLQSFGNLALFAVVFWLVSMLLQRVVIKSVYSVNDSLAKITNGDLNEKVDVSTTIEFVALSKGVNATVAALKTSIENEAKRIEAELEMGRAIQRAALPNDFPDSKHLEVAGELFTAKEVGGDFYDFFYLDDNRFLIEIADVSGKGIAAALFMMSAKMLLHKSIQSGLSLEKAIERANAELSRGNTNFMFLTAFFAVLDLNAGTLTCVNAGHNPPLIKRKGESWEYLRVEPSLIVGIDEESAYSSETIKFERGDMLYLYTDGVSEAMNMKHQPWGEERVQEALNATSGSPQDIVRAMHAAITAYADGAPQSDDVTELTLLYK